MQRILLLTVVLAAVLLLGLVQAKQGRVVLYNRTSVPENWSRGSLATFNEQIKFTFVLKGENRDKLESLFWEVSNPQHEKYQAYLTQQQIKDLVSPKPNDLAMLYKAFNDAGIMKEHIQHHGDSFIIHTNILAASTYFQTKFYHYQHETGHNTIRQYGEYSIPAHISHLVEMVLDIHTFPTINQRLRMKAERADFHTRIAALRNPNAPTPAWVPQAVADVYKVPHPLPPLSNASSTAGVIEWIEETFSAQDLANFSKNTNTPLAPVDAHHIYGNNSEAPPGLESSLDIQWLEGIAPAVTPWFWLESDPNVWMYTFTVDFLSAVDYPMVISLSYGLPEVAQCRQFDPSDCNGVDYTTYIHMVDKQFMKIGLIGVSTIVCSQDRGTYLSDPNKLTNLPADIRPFLPEYPGTSPYVTSVGATEMANPVFNLQNPPPACNGHTWTCISGGNEQAVNSSTSFYLSGGGFSNADARPSYQEKAVQAYFNSGVTLPPATSWNRTGRGFPDVSAIGYNGYIIDGGQEQLVSGTSMSTPIFAAIVSLLNADFIAKTGGTLGFLNQLLYGAPSTIFTDITVGDNCQSAGCKAQQDGFSCAKGWDPVTGLGSPIYTAMKDYINSLADEVVARRQQRAKLPSPTTSNPKAKHMNNRHSKIHA